jgi:hypothetical protein
MASNVQALVNTQLSTSATAFYSSPTGTWTQLTKVLLVNTDTTSHSVTVYVVPNGNSAGTAYITTAAQALLAGQSFNSPNEYGLVLNPGDFIAAFATVGAVVNFMVAGLLLT